MSAAAWEARAVRKPANVTSIDIERDEPLCGEGPSEFSYEYEVEVEFDGGNVHSSVLVSRWTDSGPVVEVARQPVQLTRLERNRAWNDIEHEALMRRDSYEADAFDRAGDR